MPPESHRSLAVTLAAEAAQATVILVGGHEGGADVDLEPLAGHGPVSRSVPGRQLDELVHQTLDSTPWPVCVVPMTLGRDPQLVADTARTLMRLTGDEVAGRVVLTEPFADATLLTGWLRVAVSRAAGQLGATDLAVLLTANAANRFDDAELFRIAHLVKSQVNVPWVEVALRGGDPDLAAGVERCEQLGARQIAVIPADFGPAVTGPGLLPGVVDGGTLLTPAAVSGMVATRVDSAMLKLGRGDDGIAAGLDADHEHGHGGAPWHETSCDPD
ncbi:hypothetical protein [Catenulispora subtropica]|uniref:Cobalamin biosynthesis protein CbiX n=1 Tax=Catenulispora subtropica TaxID=450798 RepID=A0ABP5DYM2_9ACTN